MRAWLRAHRRTVLLPLLYLLVASAVAVMVTAVIAEGRDRAERDAAFLARLESSQAALLRQGDTLEALLARQDADIDDRARLTADAIAELTKLQQAQLDAHDADVTRKLQVILDEIGRLDSPTRVLRLPAAAPRPAPARTTAPRPAPAPRVAPAPRPAPPPPCETSGRSGRCKK